MKLIGLMLVRNEDWIVGLSARVALKWCDELVVLNHASTDGTFDILSDLGREEPGRVHIISAGDEKWAEMEHRQRTLEEARRRGASHIAIIDADEVLTANMVRGARDWASVHAPGVVVEFPLYNMRGPSRFHANGIWGTRTVSVAIKESPRLAWTGDRFHCREPLREYNRHAPIAQGFGGILHYWGADERRLRAKHALYKAVERVRWPQKPVSEIDRLYNLWQMNPAWTLREIPEDWRWPELEAKYLRTEPVKELWQEREVRHLVSRHGRDYFSGLDLFGVA